ncbi:MAG: transketolase [Bacteroidota bacterium]
MEELLKEHARYIRMHVIRSLAAAGSGHLGGSLGLADIFSVLYFHALKHDPKNPEWAERDRMILSIGHVAPVLYAALAEADYFPKEELLTLRKMGSRLQGHPGKDFGLPGVELSAGSLGQGLSVAVGLSLAAKTDKKLWRTYCVMGDGEIQEGSVWEAAMSAAHYKLSNLTAIIDRNFCQIDGRTADVMELEPLAEKWKAFGWNVISCNGNDVMEVVNAFDQAKEYSKGPSVIIAKTLMGKGVKEIEDDFRWHGKAPSAKQAELFIQSLI